MTAEESRVLGAVQRGEIPNGGPSEVVAHGLADQAPAEYWERWSREASDRIRHQVLEAKCRCRIAPPGTTADGRCGRCYSRVEAW
jgi:uncharacterized paraquat-inducible protein A